jgi:hypothetical protein
MEDVPEFKRTPTEGSSIDKKPVDVDDVVVDEEKSIQSSEDEVKVIKKAEEVALLVGFIHSYDGRAHSDDGFSLRLSARRTTPPFLSSPSAQCSLVSD